MPNIVFLGTSAFAVPSLQGLAKTLGYKPVLVITQPDKPVGRKQALTPSAVKITAEKLDIEVLQPEKIGEMCDKIADYKPDVIVLSAYGQFMPKAFLTIAPFGIVNIHPSLLPKYRGASPIQAVIKDGSRVTGVTLILLDDKLDHGPTIASQEVKIGAHDDARSLHDRLANAGADLLMKVLPCYFAGEITPVPQDDALATYTEKLTREIGKLDFSFSAQVIERTVRAYRFWPGTYTFLASKNGRIQHKCKILDVALSVGALTVPSGPLRPGDLFTLDNKTLCAATGDGVLKINQFQMEGKKRITGEEFLRGYKVEEWALV